MWKRMRKRIRRLSEEAIEKKKVELGMKEVPELESKKEPTKKKELGKKVDTERKKAYAALERLRVFVPTDSPIVPTLGKPVIEVYNQHEFYRDVHIVLHYLMNKEDK